MIHDRRDYGRWLVTKCWDDEDHTDNDRRTEVVHVAIRLFSCSTCAAHVA